MKKIILLSFALCAGLSAFSQNQNNSNAVLPWRTGGNNASNNDFLGTTNNTDLIFSTNNQARGRISGGGDLIWDGGGKIRIGPTNPVANLMFELNGNGVVNGEFNVNRGKFVKAIIQDLRPDTIHMDTNKVIHGDTRLVGNLTVKNDLTVGGNAKIAGTLTGSSADFSGTVSTSNLRVSSLAGGATLSEVYADGNGNLKLGGTGPGAQVPLFCAVKSLNWTLGGNNIASWILNGDQPAAGTCDNYDFILKANNTKYVWLKPNGMLGIGNANPHYNLDVSGSARVTGVLSAGSVNIGGNIAADKLITSRITAPDTNGIHIGDSSMTFQSVGGYDNMRSSQGKISIGNVARAFGANSIAIGGGGTETNGATSFAFGWNVKTGSSATSGIAIGS